MGEKCFGRGKELGDYEPHIHVPMDRFAGEQGLEALGLDDVLTFAFCEPCTKKGGNYELESHSLEADPGKSQ